MKARFEAIPNLKIRDIRAHEEVSIKEVFVEMTVDDKYNISLYFPDSSRMRRQRWRHLDTPDGVMIRCPGHAWWFALGRDGDLEEQLGCEIRNAHDFFTHFGEIMELIEATPADILDEQRAPPDSAIGSMYFALSISCPDPASQPE